MNSFEGILRQAETWIEKCLTGHPNCQPRKDSSQFPTRLIDVGPPDGSRDPFLFIPALPLDNPKVSNVDLEEGNAKTPKIGKLLSLLSIPGPNEATKAKARAGLYVALSYCWGNTPNLVTTTKNISKMRDRIPWNKIPATIQDAISVTRGLGIQYLWVDALCIIQDWKEDWEAEAPKMAQVYGGAFLTISAALAPDTSHRLIDRQRGAAGLSKLPRSRAIDLPLQDDQLYSRAWALQERILSIRLLIFGSDQLYWECQDCQKGEDGTKLVKSISWRLSTEVSYKDWHAIVRDYTCRLLTVETDKLYALAGLEAIYRQATHDQYLSGLWRKSLVSDLLWQQKHVVYGHKAVPRAPLLYRAPSWSWASIDGNALFPLTGRPHYQAEAELLGTYLDPVEGEVPRAGEWLWLRAPLVKSNTHGDITHISGKELTVAFMDIQAGEANVNVLAPDANPFNWNKNIPMSETWCVLLATDQGEAFGLVLRKMEATESDFQRIGSFMSNNEQNKIALQEAGKSELFIL
ncbi:hypothetical protein G7Y89_g10279 [Cudoniella acicularis]|uniref:Heterokaryon incompatibility domain-containing protein n=1 Tax=Cudoniella acicularis TaxID=354080 RepID=A0A8H4RFD7_9HELO|nr:hypothetical protein G7Y89_g10279 [Cudoniella acicularis]